MNKVITNKEWTNGMAKISQEDFLELCRKHHKFPNIKAKEMKEYMEDEIGLCLSLCTISNKLARAKIQIKKQQITKQQEDGIIMSQFMRRKLSKDGVFPTAYYLIKTILWRMK